MEEAIRIVDGINPPARGFGAFASAWRCPPAGMGDASPGAEDDVDRARAQEYGVLASLLLHAPDAAMLVRLAYLRGTATPIGLAHAALAEAASAAAADALQREYFDLFVGVGRGELVPYASYYRTGFLYDAPLARLRQELRQMGLERADGHAEPEDHIGTLCEVMSGLANGGFGLIDADERGFFERHVAPWATRFFEDLEHAGSARFYRTVGTVGRIFLELETDAFAMER